MYALCADALLNAMRTKIEHLEAGNYVFVEVFYTCNYVEIYVNYIHIQITYHSEITDQELRIFAKTLKGKTPIYISKQPAIVRLSYQRLQTKSQNFSFPPIFSFKTKKNVQAGLSLINQQAVSVQYLCYVRNNLLFSLYFHHQEKSLMSRSQKFLSLTSPQRWTTWCLPCLRRNSTSMSRSGTLSNAR